MFCTNQEDIVAHARYCYEQYPTIVNNIPKDTNKYNNTMDDFAYMDSMLAGSQRDIGESSNLAQIAQSYASSFDDPKYGDYVAILSVIAQASIDSSKRRFNIDIAGEIQRIKKDMDVPANGYPKFWATIKRGFNRSNINPELTCPMNYLSDLAVKTPKYKLDTIDICDFFEDIKFDESRKICKRVEALIEKYQLKIGKYNHDFLNDSIEEYLLLRSDFDALIQDIRNVFISRNYRSLMYWLLKRAFSLSLGVVQNRNKMSMITSKNKSMLLKVLYEVNRDVFLSCFKKAL